jgi:hypothetical protein
MLSKCIIPTYTPTPVSYYSTQPKPWLWKPEKDLTKKVVKPSISWKAQEKKVPPKSSQLIEKFWQQKRNYSTNNHEEPQKTSYIKEGFKWGFLGLVVLGLGTVGVVLYKASKYDDDEKPLVFIRADEALYRVFPSGEYSSKNPINHFILTRLFGSFYQGGAPVTSYDWIITSNLEALGLFYRYYSFCITHVDNQDNEETYDCNVYPRSLYMSFIRLTSYFADYRFYTNEKDLESMLKKANIQKRKVFQVSSNFTAQALSDNANHLPISAHNLVLDFQLVKVFYQLLYQA